MENAKKTSLKMSERLHNRLKAAAAARGTTISDAISEAAESWIAKGGRDRDSVTISDSDPGEIPPVASLIYILRNATPQVREHVDWHLTIYEKMVRERIAM